MKHLVKTLCVISISLLGCTPIKPPSALPQFVAKPAAVSFEACPTKDENGLVVNGVFPDLKKFKIENQAKVLGNLKMTIAGADATAFKLGSGIPESIPGLDEVEIPVEFSPSKKGDLKADLVISDETEGTDDVTVTLTGTGINLPAQATLQSSPQKTDKSGFNTCVFGSPGSDCSLDFPDTLFDQSNTLELKLKNTGCPTLKITGIEVVGDGQGFTIDSPAAPTAVSPILLSSADGNQEITVTIRFNPTDNGQGDSLRLAAIKILSNDIATGDGSGIPALLTVQGNAVKPSMYTNPTFCDFNNVNDKCGNATKEAGKAKFRITNDGMTAVKIDSVKFKSTGTTSGISNRFTLGTPSIIGTTLQTTMGTDLIVNHSDMPIYVSDQIEITGSIPGQAVGSAGKVLVAVYGGVKPCLTTEPGDQLDFAGSMEELSAKSIKIKNGAGCGTLIINSVSVDQSPFFSIIDPMIPANTQVGAGQSFEATVQYKRPVSGGMQLGTLRVKTNDTDFVGPEFKKVVLYSNVPLDTLPIALASVCSTAELTADPTCLVGKSSGIEYSLSVIGTPQLTISGAKSTDDGMISRYRFRLIAPFPPGVTTGALANHDVQIMTPTTKLTIPTGGFGSYRIALDVYDNRMQKSATAAQIIITVQQ